MGFSPNTTVLIVQIGGGSEYMTASPLETNTNLRGPTYLVPFIDAFMFKNILGSQNNIKALSALLGPG